VTDLRVDAIASLERQLAATPREVRPHEHAVLVYRLGLAYSETPSGEAGEHLRRALACYDVAAEILDPSHSPVEHARVLLAAGAARRGLGAPSAAADLFGQAARLLDVRQGGNEAGAAHNDLGLARLDGRDVPGAVEAFDAALDRFDVTSEDGRRGTAATLHNRGLAHASTGRVDDLRAALRDYAAALDAVSAEEAPLHVGLAQHSAGVAALALAERSSSEREAWCQSAIEAFTSALDVLARRTFPFHHAVTSYDLGLAWLAAGDALRALVRFEDALLGFDPRTQRPQWQQAYASLSKVEADLATGAPGLARADHFVRLAVEVSPAERQTLVAARLHRLLELPEATARSRISELALAVARCDTGEEDAPDHAAASIIGTVLSSLMEIPGGALELALEAWMAAHATLDGDLLARANGRLEHAVGDALGGPQRVLVRDRLTSLGYERP